MTTRYAWIALAAAGALGLAGCADNDVGPASSSTTATSPRTPGSSTGAPAGSDSNVQGAGSAGASATPPPSN